MTTLTWRDYIDDQRCQRRNAEILYGTGSEDATPEAQEKEEEGRPPERGTDPEPGGVGPEKDPGGGEASVLFSYPDGREARCCCRIAPEKERCDIGDPGPINSKPAL